jgi:hypothetical protein
MPSHYWQLANAYDPNVAQAQQMSNLLVQKFAEVLGVRSARGATTEALTGGIELSGAGHPRPVLWPMVA